MKKKRLIIIALLTLAILISSSTVNSIHYVKQAESIEQHFPSIRAGNYYTYLKSVIFNGEKTKSTIKLEIVNVTIEEKYFEVAYRIYIDSEVKEDSIKSDYNRIHITFGELKVFNTSAASYDKLRENYTRAYFTYYWIGSTPIKALVLEKDKENYREKLMIDEGLGIILELDIVNSTKTIKYILIETNEIFPHLGGITFFGIIIGAIIMSLVFFEIKVHKESE